MFSFSIFEKDEKYQRYRLGYLEGRLSRLKEEIIVIITVSVTPWHSFPVRKRPHPYLSLRAGISTRTLPPTPYFVHLELPEVSRLTGYEGPGEKGVQKSKR